MTKHEKPWIAGYLEAVAEAYDLTGDGVIVRSLLRNLGCTKNDFIGVNFSKQATELLADFYNSY